MLLAPHLLSQSFALGHRGVGAVECTLNTSNLMGAAAWCTLVDARLLLGLLHGCIHGCIVAIAMSVTLYVKGFVVLF